MKHFFNKTTIILSLYTVLMLCMGGATVIEKLQGTEQAVACVYGTWWFITLWGILGLLSVHFLLKKQMHKRFAVFLLHLSFGLILIGALVTHLTAENGSVHLRKGESVSVFTDKENLIHHLPFVLTLSDFDIIHYKGTDAVMDYSCNIEVEKGEILSNIKISMNRIGKVSGYRFYQSAYDSDGQGTVLLVVHDPYGIALTYAGYGLLLLSLIATLCSKHTRIRELYRLATKPAAVLMILGLTTVIPAYAQEKPASVNREIAQSMGQIAVLYNGRICPLNTAATEFVTKLCGKSSWQGYSANEIFVSWMIYYTEWENRKIIRVKSAEVQKLLGIDSQWASVRDFYTPEQTYKLKDKANDTSLPETTRKAIRETDEKVQVVALFYNSEMLRMFPLTVNGKMDWYTPGSTELPLGTPEAEFQFINHAMDYLTKSILGNEVAEAKTLIRKIRLYQQEKAGEVMPSAAAIKGEILYNSLQAARWVVFLCLTLSLLFCWTSLAGNRHKVVKVLHTVFFAFQLGFLSLLLLMRWWISGHVPMTNGFETMLFMAWSMLVITLLVMKKITVFKALGPVVSAFCMLVSMLAVGSPQITNLMPVLQSPLLSIHVALVMISYALFTMIALIAVHSLWIRKKQQAEFERMTAVSQLLLYPAVSLLALGIFVGAVWANVSWGTYWSWDPKETWALITLMIYALALHRSFMPVSKPAMYHAYVLLAFLTVLMTYFGVNYLLSGMHSYA